MIKAGDMVVIDAEFDHPGINKLKADDPNVFEAEGEVIYIEDVHKEETRPDGNTTRIYTGRHAEVDWDDGEGTGTYDINWLIKVDQFKPEPNNPNKTFRFDRFHSSAESERFHALAEKVASLDKPGEIMPALKDSIEYLERTLFHEET